MSAKSEGGRSLPKMPLLPVCARIDGKAFHSWTRGMERPFDERLHNLFVATTTFLVEETQAKIGYTQSDEITLIWYSDDVDSQIFFDGKIHKMVSVLASMTTGFFNAKQPEIIRGWPSPAFL
jgi:tRNA(His) guanylyltransferase